ncbi:butyrophilin-like protein 2 isoform X3 [Scomber scombrus]|uniref:Butyrophilin-like protein 2 isoform X3 n=1 Tax=Scomber scombrus TaxID=13677 RepID=A0AAV1PWC7_SCOSC
MLHLMFYACLLSLAAAASGKGQTVTLLIIDEGSDAILPCSVSTKVDITSDRFDWKKDPQTEVFFYDRGDHNNNGQDQQYKERVSHFPNELTSGNASIIIRNTKVADSGNYTCIFPDLQEGSIVSSVQLVVRASPKPYTMMSNATDDGVMLTCEVLGASPQPKLQWQDTNGKVLESDEPQVTEKGRRYYVTLQTTVKQTETKCFVCVATQEAISHTVKAEITVPVSEKCETPGISVRDVIMLGIGLLVGCAVGAVGIGGTVIYFKFNRKESRGHKDQSTTNGHPVKMSELSHEDPDANERLTVAVE